MDYIKEYIQTVNRATAELIKTETDRPVIVRNAEGVITEINLDIKVIHAFYYSGNARTICPKKIKATVIDMMPEETNLEQSYLETLLFGKDSAGSKVTDLPRHKTTGKKCSTQTRLDNHSNLFGLRKQLHGITINEKNTQVKHRLLFTEHEYADVKVYINTNANILSPIKKDKDFDYDNAVISVKVSSNIYSPFEYYSIGNAEKVDKTELILNSIIYDVPNACYIFMDYSSKENYEILPVECNPDNREGKCRRAEVLNTIRSLITDIIFYDENGWKAEPSNVRCSECEIMTCENRGKIETI